MTTLLIVPLQASDLAELAGAICTDAVYAHLGGKAPALQQFASGLRRSLAGPPEHRQSERWLNYLVRDGDRGQVLGRLEATVHDGIAEVAFLFAAGAWGHGNAFWGLRWLQQELIRTCGPVGFWATTVPANVRCRALLTRAGYVPVAPADAPRLLSYDDGDLVFAHRIPA